MDGGYGGDNLVDEEEVIMAIKTCIESAFGKSADQPYSPALVQKAGDHLINTCLKNLAQQSKEYKWAVTCVVQQKTGAGLARRRKTRSATAALWSNGVASQQLPSRVPGLLIFCFAFFFFFFNRSRAAACTGTRSATRGARSRGRTTSST